MRISPLAVTALSLVILAACQPATKSGERVTIAWGIENMQEDDTGKTTADVSLVITKESGKKHTIPLGSYDGCGPEAAPEKGPLLSLKCWRAGGGDEFQIRTDATNVLVIEHRAVDEELPIPAFSTVRTVALEDGVVIVPIATDAQ